MVMMRLIPLFSRLAVIEEPLAVIRLHGSNTYQRSRLTADSISRELDISQCVWEEQRRRLRQIHPALADSLTPLDSARCILVQRFISARLGRRPEYRCHHQRLLKCIRARREPILYRAVWWAAAFVPGVFFDEIINTAFTYNSLKQVVHRLARPFSAGSKAIEKWRIQLKSSIDLPDTKSPVRQSNAADPSKNAEESAD
jgi:hypothetical protein